MKVINSKYILIVAVIAGVLWMVKDSFTQPGIRDLKGNFTELAFYRNENNTGPVIRIYAVSVSDTLYSEMQDYGNLMPHTKYGTTRVFFFKNTSPVPNTIQAIPPYFDPAFASSCIGVYEKNGMSKVSFAKSLY